MLITCGGNILIRDIDAAMVLFSQHGTSGRTSGWFMRFPRLGSGLLHHDGALGLFSVVCVGSL